MAVGANGNGMSTTSGKTERDLRVDLAAAYNILDYLNLGEGNQTPGSASVPSLTYSLFT